MPCSAAVIRNPATTAITSRVYVSTSERGPRIDGMGLSPSTQSTRIASGHGAISDSNVPNPIIATEPPISFWYGRR